MLLGLGVVIITGIASGWGTGSLGLGSLLLGNDGGGMTLRFGGCQHWAHQGRVRCLWSMLGPGGLSLMMLVVELGGHHHQAHLSRGLTTVIAVDLAIVTVATVHHHSHCHLCQQSAMRVRKTTYHNLLLSSLSFTSLLFMLELG